MKLKPQLPKTVYPDNVISILTVIILTGAYLFALVAGAVVHDALRMLLVLPMGMVVFILNRKHRVGCYPFRCWCGLGGLPILVFFIVGYTSIKVMKS